MKSTENQRTKKKEEVWYDERGESWEVKWVWI